MVILSMVSALTAALVGSGALPSLASQSPTPSSRPSAQAETPAAVAAKTPFTSFAVYGLSRARGVPATARDVLRKVRELIERDVGSGTRAKLSTERIGLEGETRLCAEFQDSKAAARAFEQASALAKGVDLVNVTIEPCNRKEEGKR